MDTDFARAGAVLSAGQWQSALGVHSIGHGPRQQFIDTIDRMLADALKDIAQIRLRLDRIELGGADQRLEHRRARTSRIGAKMQIVLATDRYRAQRPLGGIVVRLYAPIAHETRERAPVRQRVAMGTLCPDPCGITRGVALST